VGNSQARKNVLDSNIRSIIKAPEEKVRKAIIAVLKAD
jgi:hypothetical protein